MTNTRAVGLRLLVMLVPIGISLLISALLIIAVGNNPLEVAQRIFEGAFRNERALAGVINFWIPLTLAAMGLVVTFRAGLWNIGIEGQMMAGAIGAGVIPQAILSSDVDPATLSAPLMLGGSILLAMLAGMLWAAVVSFLKTRLGVNEIFGGVALNALINVFSIYLISGPWQPEIGGSAQATAPFPEVTLYPDIAPTFPTSLLAIVLTVLSAVGVIAALWGTRWGLQLKAVGKNPRSALLLGVPTERVVLSAFLVCGALAGIAGSYRVLFTFDSLRPLSSGGIGFLGLLVVLLVGVRGIWVPFVAFAFAAILAGSTRLRVALQLDASLAGVLQGTLVLLTLLFNGVRQLLESPDEPEAEQQPVQLIGEETTR